MCISPISIRDPSDRSGKCYIAVPCGRCVECQRARKNKWLVRIMSELSVSDVAYFSLISYNDESYPDPDLPEKSEIQKLVKRLRALLSNESLFLAAMQNAAIAYSNSRLYAKDAIDLDRINGKSKCSVLS